jgi:hypothetical protein
VDGRPSPTKTTLWRPSVTFKAGWYYIVQEPLNLRRAGGDQVEVAAPRMLRRAMQRTSTNFRWPALGVSPLHTQPSLFGFCTTTVSSHRIISL